MSTLFVDSSSEESRVVNINITLKSFSYLAHIYHTSIKLRYTTLCFLCKSAFYVKLGTGRLVSCFISLTGLQ